MLGYAVMLYFTQGAIRTIGVTSSRAPFSYNGKMACRAMTELLPVCGWILEAYSAMVCLKIIKHASSIDTITMC